MFRAAPTSPTNLPPMADAGPDQAVGTGTRVTPDGTATDDPDGDALQFSWTQTGGPGSH